jgi:hypothetical protein
VLVQQKAGAPREARPRPVSSYELFRAAESLAACELRSWRAPVSALAISLAEIPESRASSWRPKPFLNLRLRSCFPFIFSPFSKGRSPAPLGSYTPNPLKSSPGRKCKSPLQQPLILRGLFSCAATILDGRTPLQRGVDHGLQRTSTIRNGPRRPYPVAPPPTVRAPLISLSTGGMREPTHDEGRSPD